MNLSDRTLTVKEKNKMGNRMEGSLSGWAESFHFYFMFVWEQKSNDNDDPFDQCEN